MTDTTDSTTDEPGSEPETSVLDSLPPTPLPDTAIKTLQEHDDIDECIPLYELADTPGNTIAVLLKHTPTTVIAVFNPNTNAWEETFRTETFSNVYDEDAEAAREDFGENLKRVYELYDRSDITLLNPTDSRMFDLQENTFKNLLTGLPDTPLSQETLLKLKQETDVIEVIPHLYLRDTNNTVFLSITFDDLLRDERRFGYAFFDKDAEEWVGTFSMAADRLDDPTDTEHEDAFNTAFDVVENAYGSHILGVVETEQEYRNWIPGTPVHDQSPE